MLPPTVFTPVPVWHRLAGMKRVLLMIAVVALVGCGKSLDERIVGAYGESSEEGADWLVFEPNGVFYWYDNGYGKDKGDHDFIWVVVDQEVHIIHPSYQDEHKNGGREGVAWACRLEDSEEKKDDELMINPNKGEQYRRIALHHAHPLYENLHPLYENPSEKSKKTSDTSEWDPEWFGPWGLLAFVFVVVGFGPRLWSFLFD
jgi:hypothetical protein